MKKYIINALEKKSVISPNIYGHFSEHLGRCIYEGLYVGENSDIPNINGMRCDVVNALKNIKIPVLRWPGGCFADEYHWKDGIGEKSDRKKMINTHWGGVLENNSFGTHEFMELCRQLGCEPYVNGNVGSGTVQEMSEWVEYMTFDGVSPMADLRAANGRKEPWSLKYFGVGNENWGCGGNMRPEYYADLFRRYQTYVRNYGKNKVFRIACGPNEGDWNWTETLMKNAAHYMDGLTMHFYTVLGNWDKKGAATGFDKDGWYNLLALGSRMEKLVTGHSEIMDRYDPEKRVALIVDEWGAWYDVEPGTNPGFLYQQNTMRDAALAALTLNIFNKHSDRVRMANIAQTVNVLQSVVLTDGGKMLLTPTYHVFDLYKEHQGGALVSSFVEADELSLPTGKLPSLTESASVDCHGKMHITISNLSADSAAEIETDIIGFEPSSASARILNAAFNAYNTFDAPDVVRPAEFTNFELAGKKLRFILPPCAVASFELK